MASTVDSASRVIFSDGHEIITEMQLSALQAGLSEDIAHGGPAGCRVTRAQHEVITRPNDDSPILFVHTAASDSTTNDTVNLRFDVGGGGSLSGAVVKVQCVFKAMKSGGLGPNTYTTPV